MTDTPRRLADIDQQVGERIRQRRILLGYTQEQLAETLDISYQQVQKYETGANRVSAGRLFQIAVELNVSVGSFFEGLTGETAGEDVAIRNAASYRNVIELVRHFQKIDDADVRQSLVNLVRTMASSDASQSGAAAPENVPEDMDQRSAERSNGQSNGLHR